MAREKKPTPTNNPLGKKLNAYLKDIEREGDYTYVAEAFNLKRPSITGWVLHGHLAKKHYP